MKALVYKGVKDLRLEDVPEPRIESPTDALIKVTLSAICGGDIHIKNAEIPLIEPGTYSVSLTVDGPGGSSTRTLQEYLRFEPKSCIADFDADSQSVVGLVPIRFYDRSESEDNILAWEWDFNANGTIDSAERNPVYTYTANGVYSVTLTIRTANCEDTLTKRDYIRVTGCHG